MSLGADYIQQLQRRIGELEHERDTWKARANNAAIKRGGETIADLVAENKRLREELQFERDVLAEHVHDKIELAVEIGRLREALRGVIDCCPHFLFNCACIKKALDLANE